MALLRALRFLLLLIPIIAANNWPQRRIDITTFAPVSNLDYEDSHLQEVEDYESSYSTTEFPSYYQTTSSYEDEYTDGEDAEEILEETETVAKDLAAGHFERSTDIRPLEKSLSELFYENHPLEKYDFKQCAALLEKDDRKVHFSYGNYSIYLSSKDPKNKIAGRVKPKTFTWQEAHGFCRMHCKELLTLDSLEKDYLIQTIVKSDGLLGIWTSGRRCDFPGCQDRDDVREDGWFWSTTGQEIHMQDQLSYKWAKTGRGGPQSDNAEFAVRGVNESCLALRHGIKGKEVLLNDMPCHFKLNVVCEEPRELGELKN